MTTPDGIYLSENVETARTYGCPRAFSRSPFRELPELPVYFPMVKVQGGHIVEAVDTDGTRWPEADDAEPDCAECGAVWNGKTDRCHLCGTGRPT